MGVTERTVEVRAEKPYEKYAWILLFITGIHGLVLTFGSTTTSSLADTFALKNFTGLTWDELVAKGSGIASFAKYLERDFGVMILGWSILLMGIAYVPYRRGERWAWYLLWIVPIFHLGAIAIGDAKFLVATILALLGLILPIRKFFPRKQP